MKRLLVILFAVLLLGGCSVGMALSGQGNPDLTVLQIGTLKHNVDAQLGFPVRTIAHENGKTGHIYQYEIGDKPSKGRAAGHAFADILTLGLWEVIGTPVEAGKGQVYNVEIFYDENNQITEIGSIREGKVETD